jgi:hypothetical protein
METAAKERNSSSRKRRVIVCLLLWAFAVPPLVNSLNNPRLEGVHRSDYMQIIAVGFCFGIGLGVALGSIRFSGE